MSKFSVAAKRFGGFMKRNAFYFLIILCIASVATVIALAVTRNNGDNPDSGLNSGDNPVIKPDDPDDPSKNPGEEDPPVKKLTFVTPCNGTVKVAFSDVDYVWNQTMERYETHSAIDFVSDDLNVYAAADGKIKEIDTDDLNGSYIVIEHEEGYVTKYMSLDKLPSLKVGAQVKQGQLLGKMSTSQGLEALDGAHLHFELLKDGVEINPLDVLVLDEK